MESVWLGWSLHLQRGKTWRLKLPSERIGSFSSQCPGLQPAWSLTLGLSGSVRWSSSLQSQLFHGRGTSLRIRPGQQAGPPKPPLSFSLEVAPRYSNSSSCCDRWRRSWENGYPSVLFDLKVKAPDWVQNAKWDSWSYRWRALNYFFTIFY